MNIKTEIKYFKKINSALLAKALPSFHLLEKEKTVYSLLGIFDSDTINDVFKCFLLHGYDKLHKELKAKLASGVLSLSEAKEKVNNCTKKLIKEIKKYSCEYSEIKNPIPNIDEFDSISNLKDSTGIKNSDITKMVKGLEKDILKFHKNVIQQVELYMAKDPLDRKLFINKSIPSTKVEELYNSLTILGKEVVKCSFNDFEQFLRGKSSNIRLKFVSKSAINTFIKRLNADNWLDLNCKNYWNYVSINVEDFKGNKWDSKSLPKNLAIDNSSRVNYSFDNIKPFEILVP